MIEKCPTIYFEITPTISIFNVWHFPDFHLDWIKRGLLEINSLRLNILTDSVYLQIKNLPKTSKILLIGKYQKYLEQIIDMARQRDEPYFKVQEGYESVIANLRKSVPSKKAQMQISMFIFNAKRIDNLRKESLFQAIPELKHLITGRVSNIELSELQ
jgi:aminoglycoside phosphotransferase family enzyme